MGRGIAVNVDTLLETVAARNIELWVEGRRLRFRALQGSLDAELRRNLSLFKADLLEKLRQNGRSKVDRAPLSYSQRSLWFLHQQAPDSSSYHVAMCVRVISTVDKSAFNDAFQAIVDRHAVLRTTYSFADEPVQLISGHVDVAVELLDATGLSEGELHEQVEARHRKPFDLSRDPVIRMSLHSRADDEHVLLVTVHHIAADAWSLLLLFRELIALYAEAAGGAPASLSKPTLAFVEYVRWQREMLEGVEGDRLWRYWRAKLAAPRALLNMSISRERPGTKSFRGASVALAFDVRLTSRLREFSKEIGATLFVVLLAAFQVLLSRLGNTEDVIVGTPTLARSKAEFLNVVGDFVNSVALRGELRSEMSFREVVIQLRQTVIEALDAQEFPLPLLVSKLQPERDPSRSPLFDAFFALQRFDQFRDLESLLAGDETITNVELEGLRLAPFHVNQQEGQFDLALQMIEQDEVLKGVFKYSKDLLDEEKVRRVADHYVALVQSLVGNPEQAIGTGDWPPTSREHAAIVEFLDRLRECDVRLKLDGEKLNVSAPKGVLDDAMRMELAARKEEIRAFLKGKQGNELVEKRQERIIRGSRDGDFPLSHAQQRLWFIRQMNPTSHAYSIPGALRIKGNLDVPALERALDELIARHECLRTRFWSVDGVARCRIEPVASIVIERLDLTHLPSHEKENAVIHAALELSERLIDLARPPLIYAMLVRLAADEQVFITVLDHIVTDGLSLGIIINDIRILYAKYAGPRTEELPDLPVQYVDYCEWERRSFRNGALNKLTGFWKEQLRGAPSLLQLPTDRPRPAIQTSNGARVSARMSVALSADLKALARRENATLFMVLIAMFQVLLHRYSGESDILVGTAVANRRRPEVDRVVGFFANNIVLRGDLSGNPSAIELIKRTRDVALRAFAHEEMPFDALVDALAIHRELDHSPVFQVMLVLQDFVSKTFEMFGLSCEAMDLPLRTARLDLAVDVLDLASGLEIHFEYNTDLFDAATVERMLRHFCKLLEEVVRRPEAAIGDLTMLSQSEYKLILEEFNEAGAGTDAPSQAIHELFEAQVAKEPAATAVLFDGTVLSYAELNKKANQLAHQLTKLGVARGSLVGVCMNRSQNMVVALLGVLKAGAAYVPLDPAFPKERLTFMIKDADLDVIVTEKALEEILVQGGQRLVPLDDMAHEFAQLEDANPIAAATANDLAYVIYTSGSTGFPKGVMLEHRSVVNFLKSMQREPGISASDRFVAVTTLSFDISGLEIFGPLSAGGTVIVASRETAIDGQALARLLDVSQATILQATPATWRLLIDAGWYGRPNLKMICGGEALPRDLAEKLVELGGELWNMYGPTETTIWSTIWKVSEQPKSISIGRPIANTQVYVLEPSGSPTPIGVAGELCIGGDGLARGYRNRPELTAEKFVSLNIPTLGEVRVYRTGDVVRFRDSGLLEFVGRRDHQAKVRGFRIELGEIETVLATMPGIKANVVHAREDVPGDQRLVAYVVSEGGETFDSDKARVILRKYLPEYMVPNVFVTLDGFPLTPNGKVDRKSLPAPISQTPKGEESISDMVLTPVQRQVADIWKVVLSRERVGLHDNFFDLGGHSLLLVKLQSRLQSEFRCQIQLVELFQRTTIAAQAERFETTEVVSSEAALARARARAEKQAQLNG
jgi:amino acid adenylation domain-containing protein